MTTLLTLVARHCLDLAVFACAYFGAYLVRFEGAIPAAALTRLTTTLPLVVLVQFALLRAYGLHRIAWRYVSLADVRRALVAMMVATLGLLAFRSLVASQWFASASWRAGYVNALSMSIGVLLIDAVFAFCGFVGVRALRRLESERVEMRARTNGHDLKAVPTLLIGAGRGGALVVREIASRPDVGLTAVGFVDDDPAKLGTQIGGVPVLGKTDAIRAVAAETGARQALITMASAPGKDVRRVTRLCQEANLPVKIIPGVFELINGSAALKRIRDVAIEDLLRREPVALDNKAISGFLRGRVILVTGAGGSIGSEICRQVARFEPRRLVLVERAENNLFHIERELRDSFPDLDLVPAIGDVTDAARMDQVFGAHRPNSVFHAAAHKHVPMMETNPGEAVKNNVLGTITIADAADRFGASEFVLISTDKAVNPVSVMGATKRAAEIYVQACSARSDTRFVAVRFGNVLGSAGSVVPIFQAQIKRGGPLTITHPDMRRYFMTIPEATQLVLQAAAVGESGEIMILDMGEPVKVVDLAKDLIRLSGLREKDDIDIVFTGLRPGERLFEELSTSDEAAAPRRHPRVLVGRIRAPAWDEVAGAVDRLRATLERGNDEAIRMGLQAMVPEFSPDLPTPIASPRSSSAA